MFFASSYKSNIFSNVFFLIFVWQDVAVYNKISKSCYRKGARREQPYTHAW